MNTATEQTAAAVAARRHQSQEKLTRGEKAISQLRREGSRTTVRAIARRAGVSPTFLYENSDARTLIQAAAHTASDQRTRAADNEHDRIEATWRERALNAEEALARAQHEVLAQRKHIGELMGQIRDFDQMVPGESVQQLATENTTLKQRVHLLTQEQDSPRTTGGGPHQQPVRRPPNRRPASTTSRVATRPQALERVSRRSVLICDILSVRG